MKSLFGPLVWWELVRLARCGHAARVRVLLLYVLLLGVVGFAVVVSYVSLHQGPFHLLLQSLDPLSTRTPATWGGQLAFVLLEVQLLFVAAVAPAYAAAAVSEEKDRKTLALVLATRLTDREVVWGKAAARALLLLAAVAAGVPVLMLTLLFGGVDGGMILAGYALTAGTVVLSVGIGVNAACHAPDSRTALVRAYGQTAILVGGVLIPPFVLFSPFAMLAYHANTTGVVIPVAAGFGYPVAQAVVACVLLAEATRSLRKAGPTDGPPAPTTYPEPPRGRPAPLVFAPPAGEYAPLPPVDDADPVLWKERHAGRPSPLPALDQPARVLGMIAAVVAIMLFVTGAYLLLGRVSRALDPREAELLLRRGPEPPDWAGALLVTAGMLAGTLHLLPLAVGVTGCVAGERFRGTLDALLATPVGRRRVLRSKVRAHLERGLAFAGGAAVALGAGFGADGGVRLGVAALAAYGAGVAFVVALGTWLSVRCATPVLAFRLAMPAVVVVIGLPVLVRNTIDWNDLTPPFQVLKWAAIALALAAALLWWRAEVEVERGG